MFDRTAHGVSVALLLGQLLAAALAQKGLNVA